MTRVVICAADTCITSHSIDYVSWSFIWAGHGDHPRLYKWHGISIISMNRCKGENGSWVILICSFAFQVAASAAFLIARYFARERILKLVEGNKKFLAIDKAIGENGFKVVTLLRLSPLLPFSIGNYLYGLTSVKFVPYVLGRSASSLSPSHLFSSKRARQLVFSCD